MLTIYIVAIVIALLLAFASDKLPEIVSPSLLWHDGRGVNKIFIVAMAMLGFGVSGATVLHFNIVLFDVDSFVFSIPIAVFIFLGFCSRRDDDYATR